MRAQVKKITVENFEEFWNLFEKLIKGEFPEYSERTLNWILKNPRGHSRERIRKEIENDSILTLGAYVDGSIVGFAYGTRQWGGISFIYWLAVAPKFQHKGIGTELLKEWEKLVLGNGGFAVHLDSAEKNLQFYDKLGYKIIGHDVKGYFGADDYMLKKILREPKEEDFLNE